VKVGDVVIRAYAWAIVLSRYGLLNTIMSALGLSQLDLIYNEEAVILGLTHFLLPFAILILVGPIKSVDPSLEEAAKSLGANEIQTFLKVTLPLTMPGIVSALLICYALGVSAFVIPMVLGGGKINMLANLIYDRYVESFNPYFASSMSMILFLVALSIAYLVGRALSRWGVRLAW
jgi:ABC-type spermidine/putrescine transport system permease subunit I